MTEVEWLACTDPKSMLAFLRGKVSERKMRLFAVACCRKVRHLLVPEACEALEVAEKVAEGVVDSAARRRMREIAFHVGWVSDPSTMHRRGPAKSAVCWALARRGWQAALAAAECISHIGSMETYHSSYGGNWTAAKKRQAVLLAELLRCAFGNPLRRTAIDPTILTWNGSIVFRQVQVIYDERAFDRLPILADALEEAGCTDGDILSHCRGPGPHVLGCWVVDMLLGKE